jgi:hypothetical protein
LLFGCHDPKKEAPASIASTTVSAAATSAPAPAPVASASASSAPAAAPAACTVDEPVVVEHAARWDAGLTLVTLKDGRIALGYATGAGVPKVAILDAAGKASFAELDTSHLDQEKDDAGAKRSILRVTPLGFAADGMKMRVGVDYSDTIGASKSLRCGPADTAPFLVQALPGREGAGPATLVDCRTFTSGESEWVLASVVRRDAATDAGAPIAWVLDDKPGEGPIDDAHVVDQKVFQLAQLDKPEVHAYQAPVALGVAGTGVVFAAREEGALVMARRSATLEKVGKASHFYFGDAPTMTALAALDHQAVAVFGLYQKADVYATTFSVEAEPPKPEKLVLDDPHPPTSGDRTLFAVTYTPKSNVFLAFADGDTQATKKVRMTLLGGDLKPRVPVFDVGGDGVSEIRLAATSDGTQDSAIVTYFAAGQIKTSVVSCHPPK